MARMSVWKNGIKSYDYKFIDNNIKAMFAAGGLDILIHKYLGPANTGPSTDATKPQITNPTERSIQDLLFMENRDRVYDSNIYSIRGVYTKADQDFDLSQFGLFLSTGTVMVTFHLNDMVRILGRKIMAGDVFELQNLVDDYADVGDMSASLKRYYVVSDCSWPAEGFSQTWYPHLWRAKINPLVDSQEYKSLLTSIRAGDNDNPASIVVSQLDTYLNINSANVQQAINDVPQSGYDTSKLFTKEQAYDSPPASLNIPDTLPVTPKRGGYEGYLTGDGLAPNGYVHTSSTSFPNDPVFGSYHLRVDYVPNRLFRFDGNKWIMVEDAQRTSLNRDTSNSSLVNSFVNNTNTYVDNNQVTHNELQNINELLRAKPS